MGFDNCVCCIGCVQTVAPSLVPWVVNRIAFMPPTPPGYHVTEERQVYLIEADYGLLPMPDLVPEGTHVDTVRLRTSRGNEIHGFHFRRLDATRTIIFSHGNSTDIGIMFRRLKEFCKRLEVNVLSYEYSGYGECTGCPSEADLYADIEAAYKYLVDDCGLKADQIICYGQSIGSVPSIDLATKKPVGGLILHSALKSGLGVICSVKTTHWYDVFQNTVKIQSVKAPVFIFHGTRDFEVPLDHGQTLYEACPAEFAYEPWWVQDAGHNDIEMLYTAQYFYRIADFLSALDGGDDEQPWAANCAKARGGETSGTDDHESGSDAEREGSELLASARRP